MLVFEGIAAVVAKVTSASTIAQATAGLGIAVAGVTGAGAAGILPGPVQDGVASTVEAVTPFDLPHAVDDRISGIDDGHETSSGDDAAPVAPSTVPTTAVSSPSVAAPATAHVEHGTEIEDHGADGVEDGIHQHRGGRTPAVTPTTSGSGSDDAATPTPEVEDHHGGDDSGHGGGSGDDSDDDSNDDSGSDDHSGHGGGDDDDD